MAVTSPTTVGRTTTMAVTSYEPSAAFFWANRISSPTLRSPTVIVAPPLVIVVVDPTLIVRVQPSAVLSAMSEPLIALIVTPRNPPGPNAPSSPGPPGRATPPGHGNAPRSGTVVRG